MSAFREAIQDGGPYPAPRTIELRPEDFAATWAMRPRAPMVFGLRLPAESDVQIMRAEAAKQATTDAPDDIEVRIDTFNDALMALLVSYALCDPADVSKPHPLLEFPQDQVQQAFPSRTIQQIFDEVERLQVASSPLFVPATDQDVERLFTLIKEGALARANQMRAARCRRFLRFVLDELNPDE